MNSKLGLVLAIIFCLFLAALLGRSAALAWMALPFLCYLGAGRLAAPAGASLHAFRQISPLRSAAGSPLTMTISVTNSGAAIPRLRIIDESPVGLQVADGFTERTSALPAGDSMELHYTFQARRGQYRWEAVQAGISDPFGLFEEVLQLAAPAEARVIPEAPALRRLRLRPRQTLPAPGYNLSRRPGHGNDFFGVRQYHPGDSLRRVHWRLAARHPGRFYSKEFEREEMADIGVIVDGSLAGDLQRGGEALFEYTIQAAAAVAREALRTGNRLSALILGERVVRVFPGTGKHQLQNVLDQLAACRPGENVSLDMLKYLPVRLFPSHLLLVFVTPLRSSDLTAITRMRASGYQALVISPDPVRFAEDGTHHPLALRAAQLERRALLWRLRQMGVQVLDWPVDQPLQQAAGAIHWERV